MSTDRLGLVMLLMAACSNSAAETPPKADAEVQAEDASAAAPVPEPEAPVVAKTKSATPVANPGGECSGADLSLPASLVVGSVDGTPIAAGDLGEDARDAELEARRTYCNELDAIRSNALQRAVEDRLINAAAGKAGKDVDGYLRDTIEPMVEPPTDADAEAFYDANKKEDAPPFEAVADQVKESMLRDLSQAAYGRHVASLQGEARVERTLPEVRPEPLPVDIAAHTATFGKEDATIEVVEFSDFECPYCTRAAKAVTQLKKTHGDRIHFAYRHFPLDFHANAKTAAIYAQCAQEQGKFWEMHDAIFAASSLSLDAIRQAGAAAGLDSAKLEACAQGTSAREQVSADLLLARQVGVGGTPTFFINGRLFNGAPTAEGLGQAIDAEIAREKK